MKEFDNWLYWMLGIIITLLICNLVILTLIYLQPITLEVIISG